MMHMIVALPGRWWLCRNPPCMATTAWKTTSSPATSPASSLLLEMIAKGERKTGSRGRLRGVDTPHGIGGKLIGLDPGSHQTLWVMICAWAGQSMKKSGEKKRNPSLRIRKGDFVVPCW